MPDSTTHTVKPSNGTLTLGPGNGTLTVRTGKAGAAAKAGHDLLIEVTSWEGTLELGDAPRVTLTADARSMHVLEGSGGAKSLGDDEKVTIEQTIDAEVLKGTAIEFRSTAVKCSGDGGRIDVSGELELGGRRAPISFELVLDGGRLTGTATVTQSNWGMKPYSALFGTLKVLDDVQVMIEAELDT